MYPILAGGASASTSFARRSHGAVQHSPMLSDSPVNLDPLLDRNPNNGVDGGSIPTYDDFFFFSFFKIRVYKRNNEQLIVDRFFYFF